MFFLIMISLAIKSLVLVALFTICNYFSCSKVEYACLIMFLLIMPIFCTFISAFDILIYIPKPIKG